MQSGIWIWYNVMHFLKCFYTLLCTVGDSVLPWDSLETVFMSCDLISWCWCTLDLVLVLRLVSWSLQQDWLRKLTVSRLHFYQIFVKWQPSVIVIYLLSVFELCEYKYVNNTNTDPSTGNTLAEFFTSYHASFWGTSIRLAVLS